MLKDTPHGRLKEALAKEKRANRSLAKIKQRLIDDKKQRKRKKKNLKKKKKGVMPRLKLKREQQPQEPVTGLRKD